MFKLFALAALIAVCQASLIAPAPTVLAAPAVAVASPGLVLAPVANYASHTTLHTAPAR